LIILIAILSYCWKCRFGRGF